MDWLEEINSGEKAANWHFAVLVKNTQDQKLGMRLLKFCNESIQQLDKKRNGGNQNITVNHNYNGQGNTLTQTIIPTKE